ncbi:aminotransferase [Raoultella ornithinolytica]|nr:aminotransferase [Raoultella ornithinolytica]
MSPIEKSSKLDNVCYDIRGPVLKEAKRLEEEGNKVLKLNIGNPAPFGFDAPTRSLLMLFAICLPPRVIVTRKACTRRVRLSCSTIRRAVCAM